MKVKNIVDYLENNGALKTYIGIYNVSFELLFDYIVMVIDKDNHYKIDINDKFDAQQEIQDILYDTYKTEVRFCEECGKPYDMGFMAGDGDWYCCEDCFEESMDKCYGEGKWRGTDEEGCNGGFYESLQDNGEWEDTGIFWTEWN